MILLRQFSCFLADIFKSRGLIYELTINDFKQKYLGSYLGIIWAFVQPTITLLIFWFVFELGFRSRPTENYPFILWLMAGLIPWNFFAETVSSAAGSIVEKSYLVSKVLFRVSILPIIKILSGLFVHLFFIFLIITVFSLYGYMPSLYYLQLPYYLLASVFLLTGISWLTSSFMVFLKDVGPAIAMFVQFGFWMTPVVWSAHILPQKFQPFIKLNPVYYIVEGYRDCFIYHKWFWESPYLSIYFWVVTLFIFALGAVLFKRLRPHFADVI